MIYLDQRLDPAPRTNRLEGSLASRGRCHMQRLRYFSVKKGKMSSAFLAVKGQSIQLYCLALPASQPEEVCVVIDDKSPTYLFYCSVLCAV